MSCREPFKRILAKRASQNTTFHSLKNKAFVYAIKYQRNSNDLFTSYFMTHRLDKPASSHTLPTSNVATILTIKRVYKKMPFLYSFHRHTLPACDVQTSDMN